MESQLVVCRSHVLTPEEAAMALEKVLFEVSLWSDRKRVSWRGNRWQCPTGGLGASALWIIRRP